MDPVFNNLLIAYTIKLSKQLGEFRKVLSVIEKSGSVDVIAKSFKPVDNVGRREARDFLSFFLKSKLAFDQLKVIISLIEKNKISSALRELGPFNAKINSLIGESDAQYLKLFLTSASLKIVQEGLSRVLTMSDQATKLLFASGAREAA